MADKYRTERDSMGELQVPADALYGAQTQRAVDNFPISGEVVPFAIIRAIALIKRACAQVNAEFDLLDPALADGIRKAADRVAEGELTDHFPIDVFQTGSGTSSNMNANEVIAHVASEVAGQTVHPNDHVNMGQSSNDVFPTSIHVAACLEIHERLLPALERLAATLEKRAEDLKDTVKTGRTHLMDAMPVTLGQELGGWAAQVRHGIDRVRGALPRLEALTLGGTAVGTGINAQEGFGPRVASELRSITGVPFTSRENFLEGQSSQDAAVEMSGQCKVIATSLMKIANDLRWMNSGPLAGLGEISLVPLQPGSSIMPGKVNPVIPESVAMVCAQVSGNDTTITIAGQSGNFQLNVMLPVVGYNLVQSIQLLANASTALADKAVAGFTVNESKLREPLDKNPILVTALNAVIGYEQGAAIAKKAYAEGRPLLEVAREMTDLSEDELRGLLDPARLTRGGIVK